jgi:ABC-type cobalamin/Fe3+-siderophores transport system ATPase subunit
MSLLALESVGKRYRDGPGERVVLREVSFELEAGELAVVWGLRRSGRSTLLRVAAGIEPPDSGVVRFDGRDLAAHGEELIGGGIAFCQRLFRRASGESVLEQTIGAVLASGLGPAAARTRACAALERTGAIECAALGVHELDTAEALRVALARTLALGPRLLVVDEPVKGVELAQRDGILALLRSLADEGIAVLASAGESVGLSGADRALSLGGGTLRASPLPEPATVLPLRRRSA